MTDNIQSHYPTMLGYGGITTPYTLVPAGTTTDVLTGVEEIPQYSGVAVDLKLIAMESGVGTEWAYFHQTGFFYRTTGIVIARWVDGGEVAPTSGTMAGTELILRSSGGNYWRVSVKAPTGVALKVALFDIRISMFTEAV